MKPQITQITLIFLFFLRVPSCNFVANFMVVPHDAAASPGDSEKKMPTDYTDYTDFFVFFIICVNLCNLWA